MTSLPEPQPAAVDPGGPLYEIALRAWDTNRHRAARLVDLVSDLRRNGVLTAEQQEQARSVAHSLVGSAGTFGHETVSTSAHQIETLLAEVSGSAPARGIAELERLVLRLCEELSHDPVIEA